MAAASKKEAARKAIMKQYPDARPSPLSKKVFVATSPTHGLGMFAAEKIKCDIVLGRLEGMPTREDGTYVLWLTKKLGLEVTNDFRFINHDSDANCALTDEDVVTLRDIEPGEELFHDYGW